MKMNSIVMLKGSLMQHFRIIFDYVDQEFSR